MTRKTFVAILLASAFAAAPYTSHADEVKVPQGEEAADAEIREIVTYTIVRHDTLWDISKRFLKNPFRWPKIWKLNPYIKNPDLIYPGDIVKISPEGIEVNGVKVAGKEFAGKALPVVSLEPDKIEPAPESVTGKAVVLEPETGETPEVKEAVRPAPPPEQLKAAAIQRKGFISKAALDASGALIGTKEKKLLMNRGDEVYVSMKDRSGVNPGDRFTIFTTSAELKHPVTKKTVGYAANILGSLVIAKTGNVAEAVIDKSYKEIEPGAKLAPYKDVPGAVELSPTDADVTGYIIASLEGEGHFGKGDIVYIDKGSADGLKKGNTMRIYRKSVKAVDPISKKEIMLPPDDLGSLVVIDTEDKTASAIVTKSLKSINRGDLVSTVRQD